MLAFIDAAVAIKFPVEKVDRNLIKVEFVENPFIINCCDETVLV